MTANLAAAHIRDLSKKVHEQTKLAAVYKAQLGDEKSQTEQQNSAIQALKNERAKIIREREAAGIKAQIADDEVANQKYLVVKGEDKIAKLQQKASGLGNTVEEKMREIVRLMPFEPQSQVRFLLSNSQISLVRYQSYQ